MRKITACRSAVYLVYVVGVALFLVRTHISCFRVLMRNTIKKHVFINGDDAKFLLHLFYVYANTEYKLFESDK